MCVIWCIIITGKHSHEKKKIISFLVNLFSKSIQMFVTFFSPSYIFFSFQLIYIWFFSKLHHTVTLWLFFGFLVIPFYPLTHERNLLSNNSILLLIWKPYERKNYRTMRYFKLDSKRPLLWIFVYWYLYHKDHL